MVIPLYKLKLNRFERISLDRALTVFRNRPIEIVMPERLRRLKVERYWRWPATARFRYVPSARLSSVHAYNQWLLTDEFYAMFAEYAYMLIYQLDAYAFRDELDAWMATGLDYVGGRIYHHGAASADESWVKCTGSGGFSLRRIASFRRVLQENRRIFFQEDLRALLQAYNANGQLPRMLLYLKTALTDGLRVMAPHNALASLRFAINEDVVYGLYVPRQYSWFRVVDHDRARRFCIDHFVAEDLRALGGGLPFGTHAWWTDPAHRQVWSSYIPGCET